MEFSVSDGTGPQGGWRFGLDDEDSVVALEVPAGYEEAGVALEWYFEGLSHGKQAAKSVLVHWRKLLAENGPGYSMSTNSAGAIRLDLDTVELSSLFDHFEPVVIPNSVFEEAAEAFEEFAENDDRYR
jgi:hypothetical protein